MGGKYSTLSRHCKYSTLSSHCKYVHNFSVINWSENNHLRYIDAYVRIILK